jgi:Domain of unknown function (DUF4156)
MSRWSHSVRFPPARPRTAGCAAACAALGLLVCGCGEPILLSPGGVQVASYAGPPSAWGWNPASCRELGFLIGESSVRRSYSAEPVTAVAVDSAMNALRNEAASMGANYVQHDTPSWTPDLGGAHARVTGTAYACASVSTPAR